MYMIEEYNSIADLLTMCLNFITHYCLIFYSISNKELIMGLLNIYRFLRYLLAFFGSDFLLLISRLKNIQHLLYRLMK